MLRGAQARRHELAPRAEGEVACDGAKDAAVVEVAFKVVHQVEAWALEFMVVDEAHYLKNAKRNVY